jgi:outer membrane protein assembly factor BamB
MSSTRHASVMPFCMPTFVLLGFASIALADNWPGWRGPYGNGQSAEKSVPLEWKVPDNVRWKIELPSRGNSSPIVWGDRVFITQPLDAKGQVRSLWCIDRAKGKVLWKKEVHYKEQEPTHGTNPYCSATPVTDGKLIIASFGSAGLVCYDFNGQEQWRKDLGEMRHIWGNASSPILYKDMVILWCGPGEKQFLIALKKKTGEKVWQYDEPGGKSGENKTEWIGSWSTPVVARIGEHDELILSVPGMVKGFDPDSGKELWRCDGLGKLVYTSPVCSPDGIVIAFSGFYGPALAVQAGGKGDVTKTHRLWHHPQQNPQRIGSAIILGNYAYLVSEPGLAQCFVLKSGKDLWDKKRLGERTWSSLVAAAGHLLIANDAGEIHVLKASPDFQPVARNPLGPGEVVQASITISDGELFIRSHRHLWCIGWKR